MKILSKLCLVGLAAMTGGVFTACSSLDEPGASNPAGGFGLAKAPKVIAYSGNHTWAPGAGVSRGVDVNGNMWYQTWDRPTNVTPEEIEKVLAAVAEPRVGAKNDIHIDWNNYWVQQVYTGEKTYVDGNGNNIGTGSSHMNKLLAYNSNYEEEVWWPEYVINRGGYEHIYNFNNGKNETVYTDDVTGEQFIGTTLMTDMYAEGIIDQFGYHNSTDSKNHYEYIIIEVDGSYYICFDFYATHPDGQDANKNMDVERDWIFNDWIVKISPAYHVGETPETPETPNPDPTDPTEPETPECDICHHNHESGTTCEECGEGAECHPSDNPGNDNPGNSGNDNPDVPAVRDEVEINLSYDAKDESDERASHLSIHVRSATDVEVFIPVPAEYYCEADDMAIVMEHKEGLMVHGGPSVTEFDINGNTVKLIISFESEGIRIKTDGITEEVIAHCRENYNDGITFEVWNYFNSLSDEEGLPNDKSVYPLEDLKYLLNKATVKFLDKEPDYYINSFNKDENGEKYENDCTVSIVDEQRSDYGAPTEGEHLNGSRFNQIYEHNG